MENVTQVHGKKNKEHFDEWCEFLEIMGYSNYWKDLNAKNFGIPQNRNRTFMVSVLGDYTYEFPKEFPLELRLKDMLEDSVDEKFYLSDAMINYFTENTIRQREKGNGFKVQPTDGDCIGKAVTTRAGGRMDDNFIQVDPIRLGGLFDTDRSKHQAGSVWEKEAIAPTVDTMQGGYRQPLVIDEPKVVGGVGEKKSNGGTQWYQQDRIYDNNVAISVTTAFNPYYKTGELIAYDEQNGYIRKDGTVGTLTTDGSSPKHNNRVIQNARIRKLTPKECWRLMGFDDADFENAEKVNSNTQLYKQAGNSIVVDVLYYIFRNML